MALQVIRNLESSVLYCFVSSFLSQSNKCLRRVCPKGNIPRSSAHFTSNQWSQNNTSLLQTYACQFLSSLQPKWWLKLITWSTVSLMLSSVLFCSYLTTSVRHIPQMPLFPNDSHSVHMTLWFSNSTWEHSPFSSVLCLWNTAPTTSIFTMVLETFISLPVIAPLISPSHAVKHSCWQCLASLALWHISGKHENIAP